MRAIRKILIAVKDPAAASLPAVAKGAQLARALGATIELHHCITERIYTDIYFSGGDSIGEFERRTEQQYREGLQTIATRLIKDGVKTAATIEWDYPPHEALVRRARKIDADLIIAECHAGRRHAPWLLHLTDWELLRKSPVPVLLVKNDQPWTSPVVLAALDPSHVFSKPAKLDAEILQAGSTFSDALGGKLHAMHAYVAVPYIAFGDVASGSKLASEVAAKSARRAKTGLQQALKAFGRTRLPRHVVPGEAAEEIPRLARELKSSILVMGAVSRSALSRFLIGNTAERVLDAVRCDVLVVKPADFATSVSTRSRGVRYVSLPSPGLLR
jgi:universal stress protein E